MYTPEVTFTGKAFDRPFCVHAQELLVHCTYCCTYLCTRLASLAVCRASCTMLAALPKNRGTSAGSTPLREAFSCAPARWVRLFDRCRCSRRHCQRRRRCCRRCCFPSLLPTGKKKHKRTENIYIIHLHICECVCVCGHPPFMTWLTISSTLERLLIRGHKTL